jgi:hypothetical protein
MSLILLGRNFRKRGFAEVPKSVDVKPVAVISWIGTYFLFYGKPENAAAVLNDRSVIRVEEIDKDEGAMRFSQEIVSSQGNSIPENATRNWNDIKIGNEILPWWKAAVNTNDQSTSFNPIVVLDAPHRTTYPTDEINYQYAYNTPESANIWDGSWMIWHGNHVDGIIGAKINGSKIRGINPNQSIIRFGYGGNLSSSDSVLNSIFYHLENNNLWSVVKEPLQNLVS